MMILSGFLFFSKSSHVRGVFGSEWDNTNKRLKTYFLKIHIFSFFQPLPSWTYFLLLSKHCRKGVFKPRVGDRAADPQPGLLDAVGGDGGPSQVVLYRGNKKKSARAR